MGIWDCDNWKWNLEWSEELTAMEAVIANDLALILEHIRPRMEVVDRRQWKPHVTGSFSVQTAYMALLLRRAEVAVLPANTLKALKQLWSNDVSSKVSIFGWRVLIERLPTREAHLNKWIITSVLNSNYAFCSKKIESTQHIFLSCEVTCEVWSFIFNWMGKQALSSADIINHFLDFENLVAGSKGKRYNHFIWLATT
ncbi:hypothetical protein TSUD_218580 [Trifolium subterraneum]|uniref:Reverse transcriptase zinc-binding domain-containing protein n=1 Tax=Trifolium subterraneum TaxID=3900 RepID=A0A2Z6MMI1_TRISU|nr:hypothetical protein TSUD_218580 [Trifolium subterraneum]